jgi:hypothetical protein
MCFDFLVNNPRFIELVKNGNCSTLKIFNQEYGKCGHSLFDYSGDFVAYTPNIGCYSFKENRIYSDSGFTPTYLMTISLYGYSLLPSLLFGVSFLFILLVMIPSEYQQIYKFRNQIGFFGKMKFLCSLRNQTIFISLISSFIAFLFGFASNFTSFQLQTFGVMIATYLTFVQFVQIITLWAFFSSKSKNMAMNGLSKGQM